ncbi:hypothetical protein HYC85_010186 [Camellia sinensis]|uniref:Uncharacterized GPI-anchored protein At5g19230-like domain-containing protein n=1 Tax=Camellia sinensis TaxID=4442 RepID=A0A7J7HH79_CAMSI|nr:hypothetical protein HYC85_010186 [Camellia sinensis]
MAIVWLSNYKMLVPKVQLNNSTVRDGVILPLCVVEIVTTGLVCTNCTKSQYSKYLSNSNYTGAGINSGDSWTVIVLSTNTTTGSFVRIHARIEPTPICLFQSRLYPGIVLYNVESTTPMLNPRWRVTPESTKAYGPNSLKSTEEQLSLLY